MVQVLVVLLFLGAVQLAISLHVRNVSVHAAGEGSRRGALLGGDEGEAVARTLALLDSMLGPDRASASASRENVAGSEVLTVTVTTSLPLLLDLGPRWLTVSGRALVEERP
ncbi:ABC transporter [Schaalia sp. 19OD2882]|nr:ABC transporter [Schaalia sp. 19OD2882]